MTAQVRWALTEREETFRAEVHDWLTAERRQPYLRDLAARSSTEYFGVEPEFSRRLGEAGYIGTTTPVELGGAGRSHVEHALLQAELAWAHAPILAHFVAEREVLPSLVRYGTPAQQERYLGDLLGGRMLCAQGFTEPHAGSDLAAISARAEERPDGSLVLNGTKWLTSVAHRASHLWALVRTEGDRGHAGLTMLLLPLDRPGVEVRPLVEMTGVHRLNQVELRDVHVDPDDVVGGLGQGWAIAMDTVGRERAGASGPAGLRHLLLELGEWLATRHRRSGTDEARLSELAVRVEAAELLTHRYAWQLDAGTQQPEVGGLTLKLSCDALEQELADLGTTLMGRRGAEDVGPSAPLGGRLARRHVAAPGLSLGGGTAEILKTVLATRGLGLPRDRVSAGSPFVDAAAATTLATRTLALPQALRPSPDVALTARQLVSHPFLADLFAGAPDVLPDLPGLVGFAQRLGAAGAANLLVPHVALPWLLLDVDARAGTSVLTSALGQGDEDLDLEEAGCVEESGAVTGELSGVPGAAEADGLLVSVRSDVGPTFALLSSTDVVASAVRMIDRGPHADVRLEAAPARAVVRGDAAAARWERAVLVATLVQAAEGLGIVSRLLELCLHQGRNRVAFGGPIGGNQAFQHHCADIAVERELALAVVEHAAATGLMADAGRARAVVGDAAVRVARTALQLHGGRGYLDESEVSRLYRQAKVSQVRWGSARWHLAERRTSTRSSLLTR